MTTAVGTEAKFEDLVTHFIYLERDAVAAYDFAIWSCPCFTGHSGGCDLSCDELAW